MALEGIPYCILENLVKLKSYGDCCIALVYIKGLAGNKFLLSKQKHSYTCTCTHMCMHTKQETWRGNWSVFQMLHFCLIMFVYWLLGLSPHITLCVMIALSWGRLIKGTAPQSQCMLCFHARFGELQTVGDSLEMSRTPMDPKLSYGWFSRITC